VTWILRLVHWQCEFSENRGHALAPGASRAKRTDRYKEEQIVGTLEETEAGVEAAELWERGNAAGVSTWAEPTSFP
jgi:hypothetical protein